MTGAYCGNKKAAEVDEYREKWLGKRKKTDADLSRPLTKRPEGDRLTAPDTCCPSVAISRLPGADDRNRWSAFHDMGDAIGARARRPWTFAAYEPAALRPDPGAAGPAAARATAMYV